MKLNTLKNNSSKGFTLIEMIGVLAVIAILAAVLIPKVFDAINNSRINNAAVTCQTVKTAIADHYAKFGTLPVDGRNPASLVPITVFPETSYDKILLAETFLDKPFAVKIGDGIDANNNVVLAVATGATPTIANHDFNLDGDAAVDTAATAHVVAAVITGTSLEDARALDRLIDGPALSYTGTTQTDMRGRVKFAEATTTDGDGNTVATGAYTIMVYLTHR